MMRNGDNTGNNRNSWVTVMELVYPKNMTSEQGALCSDQRVEPLPGTAKTGTLFIAFEQPQGWAHDIMDGEAFGPELTAQLASYMSQHGASLQLIRKPGREGQIRSGHAVFIAHVEAGVAYKLRLDSPAELLHIDPARPGGEIVDHPVILVCTHGKRDRCCAFKGRPLAAALDELFPGDIIWESSHTKGHRFAPSIITLPWGYSYGHLNELAAAEMLRHCHRGELFVAGNRGRSCYAGPDQVAELAVATHLVEAGEQVKLGSLQVSAGHVVHRDGRRWDVELGQRPVDGVVSSCGEQPKVGKAWVATAVKRLP